MANRTNGFFSQSGNPATVAALLFALCSLGVLRARGQAASADRVKKEAKEAPTVAQFGGDAQPARPVVIKGVPRKPLPSREAAQAAQVKVQEIFGRDISQAIDAGQQVNVARRLAVAAERVDDEAERWALLTEAFRMAVRGGSLQEAESIIGQLTERFDVEEHAYRIEALEQLAAKPNAANVDTIAMACLKEAKLAIARNSRSQAEAVVAAGQKLARRSRNQPLLNQFTEIAIQIRTAEKRARELEDLLAKHRDAPNDQKTCLKLGQLYCFEQQDWAVGLPFLVKSDDPGLAALATRDLAIADDFTQAVVVADCWVAWARKQRGSAKNAALGRAADHYGGALKSLQGLERLSVQKKLEEIVAAHSTTAATTWLADLKPLRVENMNIGFAADGTYKDQPFTCGGEACTRSLRTMPRGAMIPASVVYGVPPSTKRLVGAVGVFIQGGPVDPAAPLLFEIKVDGRTVWKSRSLTKGNQKERFDVMVAGGTEVELSTQSEKADSAFAAWVNPVFLK